MAYANFPRYLVSAVYRTNKNPYKEKVRKNMQNMSGGKTALGLDNNIGALICYVGNLICALGLIYSIVVLVTDKTNKLPRFHAMQSILLTVINFIVILPAYFVAAAFFLMNSTITSLIGMLLWFVILIVALGLFVLMVIAAVKAFNGEIYKIPVIGNYADQWSN